MMIARIGCTESELEDGFRRLGLLSGGRETGMLAAPGLLHESELTDNLGNLTADAEMILGLLASPQRIITVSSISPGNASANQTSVLSGGAGDPFVFRGDREGHVDLVALDSPTAVIAALDETLMMGAFPHDGRTDEAVVDGQTWLALLTLADVVKQRIMETRAASHDVALVVDADGFARAISQTKQAADARWMLGAMQLVSPSFLAAGSVQAEHLVAALARTGFIVPAENSYLLSPAGRQWTAVLVGALRVSYLRIVHVFGGSPADVAALAVIRTPLAIVIARIGATDVTIVRDSPEVAIARLRAVLMGDVRPAKPEARADTRPAHDMSGIQESWVYVRESVPIRALWDTSAVAGYLQPGTWYFMVRVDGGWARVADATGAMLGWASVGDLHPRVAIPPEEWTVSEAQTERPAWTATHVVPADGLRSWAVPDGGTAPTADLAAGVALAIVERRSDWARVRAENGWEGWVDGRRLAPTGSTAAQPEPRRQKPAPRELPARLAPPVAESGAKTHQTDRIALGAVLGIIVSAFLPWIGWGYSAVDVSAAYVLTLGGADEGVPMALVLGVLAFAGLATVLVDGLHRFTPLIGGIAIGIGVIHVVLVLKDAIDYYDYDVPPLIGALFTDWLALGAWLLVASGIVLVRRR